MTRGLDTQSPLDHDKHSLCIAALSVLHSCHRGAQEFRHRHESAFSSDATRYPQPQPAPLLVARARLPLPCWHLFSLSQRRQQ